MQKEKEEKELKELDEKIRPALENKLRKELGTVKLKVSQHPAVGNTQLDPIPLDNIKIEDTGSGYSDEHTKRPLDTDPLCTPPGKKIRSYEDFKSLTTPGKGKAKPQRQVPARTLLFGSPRTRSSAQKDEYMMSIAETKINLMQTLDKFIIAKAPKG